MKKKLLTLGIVTVLLTTEFSAFAASLTLDVPGPFSCNGKIIPLPSFSKLPYFFWVTLCGSKNINVSFSDGGFILHVGPNLQHAQIISYTPQSSVGILPVDAVTMPVTDIVLYWKGLYRNN